jgi:hypothetical protein
MVIRILSAALAVALCAGPVGADAQAVSDSVTALNRSGRWPDAARRARASLANTANAEERCTLRAGMLHALARMGLAGPAAEELKTFDRECASSAAARQRARDLAEIRALVDLPPLPTTGLDFSSVDHFWGMVDRLQRGETGTEEQWRALLTSPGYRLALDNVPTLREDITIAFSPARRSAFDSLTAQLTDRAYRLRHLARALPLRGALDALRDSLARSPAIQQGVSGAQRFLPANATSGEPPLVAVAIFNNDGYAGPSGAIVDLLYIRENGLVDLLSHEFHHVYGDRYNKVRRPPPDSADAQLVAALSALMVEGIADLIDKPHPLISRDTTMASYVTRYNDVYARTPAILRTVDSLLVTVAGNPAQMRPVGQRVRTLLWSNSHPNGAYMARTIHETLGRDALMPGLENPFVFIKAYATAEQRRGNPAPFSPRAIAVLNALEMKYRR